MPEPVDWYNRHVSDVAASYEAFDPTQIHSWMRGLIAKRPGTVLDIGAGTGRDAAWFVGLGYDVVAVEPSSALRSLGQEIHPHANIRWLSDKLPNLRATIALGICFDIVMLNAVWQHVSPSERDRAFRKISGLMKPGGLLIMSLRTGPAAPERVMYPVSLDELERLARNHGLLVEKIHLAPDRQDRSGVTWTNVALRLLDDGTGAFPLLRHIILNDQKSSTYKLGLLRALCRAADGSAGLVTETDDEFVKVPLGLIALNWLRLYLPLLREEFPQTPTNVGSSGLGFVGEGFKHLLTSGAANDLKIAARFTNIEAKSIHAALRDAARTIDDMPATFMTYPDGKRILTIERGSSGRAHDTIELDAACLASFGWMRVPAHIWRCMRQYAAWIEPTLNAEWLRKMQDYAQGQNRQISENKIASAMRWIDPERDVKRVQKIAYRILDSGELHCIWSGQRLSRENLDIDHMFPWSAWPCSDLWNLMPAHRTVNQNQKRDQLPSAATLGKASEPIMAWWKRAYVSQTTTPLPEQFYTEAKATLPPFSNSTTSDVLESVAMQRIRLRHDQQVPEWDFRT